MKKRGDPKRKIQVGDQINVYVNSRHKELNACCCQEDLILL